jgi:hypothetical protein
MLNLSGLIRRRKRAPRIVSLREDGLCMRINTILDAAILAGLCDLDYGFVWDETATPALDQQTTGSARRVFTAEYLARHREPHGTRRPGAPDLFSPVRTEAALHSLLDRARTAGVIYLDQPRALDEFFAPLAPRLAPDAHARAFAALGFTPSVQAAISLARSLPLAPGARALHLRGGDILHGTHSHQATYLHKAPSLLEIEAQLNAFGPQSPPVWLIGQEPDVQAALAAAFPQVRAFGVTDPIPPLGEVEQVLFDAVFLSRMAHIHGGNSGVTLLSRRLGGVPFTDMAGVDYALTAESLADDPLSAPRHAGVSAHSKAHAYVKIVTACDPADWRDSHLRLMGLARAWRPDSAFLELMQACVLARLGHLAAAEAACRAVLTTAPAPGTDPDMLYAFLTGGAHYFPMRQVAALAGLTTPACGLFAALHARLTDPAQDGVDRALARLESALAPQTIPAALRARVLACRD